MELAKRGIVRNKLFEGNGLKSVHVNARIKHTGTSHDQRPVVVTRIVVDVSVDHVGSTRLWIGQHRIVAKRRRLTVYVNFLDSLDALEVVPQSDFARP